MKQPLHYYKQAKCRPRTVCHLKPSAPLHLLAVFVNATTHENNTNRNCLTSLHNTIVVTLPDEQLMIPFSSPTSCAAVACHPGFTVTPFVVICCWWLALLQHPVPVYLSYRRPPPTTLGVRQYERQNATPLLYKL